MPLPRLPSAALLLASLAVAGAAAADARDLALPAGSGQQALALRVGQDGITARACAAAPCSPAGGQALSVPAEVVPLLGQARVRAITLADGKQLARVDVPGRDGGAWVALVAAPLAGKGSAPAVLWSGWAGVERGEHGEERSQVVIEEPAGKGSRVIVGQRRADVTLCGRPTLVAAREVEPATMTLARGAAVQNLTAEERGRAPTIQAVRRDGAFEAPAFRLLRPTAASSALGKRLAQIADGDPATFWSEAKEGIGRGEFVSFSAPSEVGIRGLELRIRPSGAIDPDSVAPRWLFLATQDRLFQIALPEDAWRAAGAGYEVKLPEEVRASCVALVIDEATVPRGLKGPEVTISEVTARTELDGMSPAALVGALAGGGERARAAAAALVRGGPAATRAAMEGYGKLDEQGRLLAMDVIDAAPCAEQAPFFAERLIGVAAEEAREKAERRAHRDAVPEGPSPEAHHARDRIRRCGQEAAATLARIALEGLPTPGGAEPSPAAQRAARVTAARELALAAPAAAVPALLDAIAKADDATRRELRAALAQAAQSARGREALAAELAPERLTARPEVAQIDLLRAAGRALAQVDGAGEALHRLAGPGASFRARYLLLAPAAELAKAGDARALDLLRAALRRDPDRHVRARAAEVAARVPALAPDVLAAVGDPEVRVREAAIASLGAAIAAGAPPPAGAEAAVAARLASDPWTFIRSRAARALGALPGAAAGNKALAAALKDLSPAVRGHALDALGARRAVAHRDAVRDRAEDPGEATEVRARALLALGDMCDRGSVDLWTKLAQRARTPLGERDQRLGQAAIAALGRVRPADLQKRLAPLLDKGVPRPVQESARSALEARGAGPCR